MSPLDTDMLLIDEFHYVMYRLGKKENGLQIFYRCLRGTQDECPRHRRVADRIESEGIRTMLFASYYIDTVFTSLTINITGLHPLQD